MKVKTDTSQTITLVGYRERHSGL